MKGAVQVVQLNWSSVFLILNIFTFHLYVFSGTAMSALILVLLVSSCWGDSTQKVGRKINLTKSFPPGYSKRSTFCQISELRVWHKDKQGSKVGEREEKG